MQFALLNIQTHSKSAPPRPQAQTCATPEQGSALPSLAVRGYMRIEPVTRVGDEPDFLLRRLKPILGDPTIRPLELFVLAVIVAVAVMMVMVIAG